MVSEVRAWDRKRPVAPGKAGLSARGTARRPQARLAGEGSVTFQTEAGEAAPGHPAASLPRRGQGSPSNGRLASASGSWPLAGVWYPVTGLHTKGLGCPGSWYPMSGVHRPCQTHRWARPLSSVLESPLPWSAGGTCDWTETEVGGEGVSLIRLRDTEPEMGVSQSSVSHREPGV